MAATVGPRHESALHEPVQGSWVSPTHLVVLGAALAALLSAAFAFSGPLGVVLVMIGAAAVVVTIYYPGILLAAYLLLPFYKGAVQPYSPLDITAVLAFLCVLQIVPLLREGRLLTVPRPLVVLWAMMAFIVVAGVLYAPDQEIGVVRAVSFISLVSLPLAFAALRVGASERDLRHLVWAYALMGAITVLTGLIAPTEGDRLALMGANTIQTSRAALLLPLVLIAVIPAVGSVLVRSLAVVLAIAAVLVALSTGSRGPLVALLFLGVIGAARLLARPTTVNVRLVLATAAVASVAIVAAVSGAIDLPAAATLRFEVFGEFVSQAISGDDSAADTSASRRLQLFSAAFAAFEANPLMGLGTGGYEVASPAALWPSPGDEYPHNAFLQLASEHGVIGVAIFAGLVILAFIRPVPAGSYGHVVRVLFLFFLLNAMFSEDIYGARQVWGLMVLLALIDLPPPAADAPKGSDQVPTYLTPAPTWQPDWAIRRDDWQPLSRLEPEVHSEPGPYALPPPTQRGQR